MEKKKKIQPRKVNFVAIILSLALGLVISLLVSVW